MGCLENYALIFWIHYLSSCLGGFYIAFGPQIQQSAYHKIHVISNVTYLFNDPFDDCWYYSIISGGQTESTALLVRVGTFNMA